MSKQILSEELRRMRVLAGIINESDSYQGAPDNTELYDKEIFMPEHIPFTGGKIKMIDGDMVHFTLNVFGRPWPLTTPVSNVIDNKIQNWNLVQDENANKKFKGFELKKDFKHYIYYTIAKMGYEIKNDSEDFEDSFYADANDPNFRYVFQGPNKNGIIKGYGGVVTYFEGDSSSGVLVTDENHLKSLLSN